MATYSVDLNFIPVNEKEEPIMSETLAAYFGRNLLKRKSTTNPLLEYEVGLQLLNEEVIQIGDIETLEYFKAILINSDEENIIKGQALAAIVTNP
jgi:hypothetical protein